MLTFHLDVVGLRDVQQIVAFCDLERMLSTIFINKCHMKSTQIRLSASCVILQRMCRPTLRPVLVDLYVHVSELKML
jgi:hypothetical protein